MSHHTQATMFASAAQSDASSFLLGPGPPIVTGDSERGPAGCNLFVFHLPNELTNWDLYLLFRKFGTIVSVHTMINKNTGLSRGFGFVSFSIEDEAIAAVRSMDGFRLGKKRLKVQRKREHEEDDEVFGLEFENLCGQSGLPSNIAANDLSNLSSLSSSPTYGTPSLSALSQSQMPQRFNAQLLNSSSSSMPTRVITANMSGPVGRMSPTRLLPERELVQGQTTSNQTTFDFTQDIRRPQRAQSFAEGHMGSNPFDTRGKTTIVTRDGMGREGPMGGSMRSMGREGGVGVRANPGNPSDFGRSPGILEQNDDNGVGNQQIYHESRVRNRRNSNDSFFFTRNPEILSEEAVMFPSAGLSLPPTPKQTAQFYQSAYQQQQQQHQQQYREDRQQGALQADYEHDRRERSRSYSLSTTGSLSTGGKTSIEQLDNNKERDIVDERFHANTEKICSDDEMQHRAQQHYVYSDKDGQYSRR